MRSHTVTRGFWTQTCVASLLRNPPCAEGYNVKVVVVNNSPWSPAIKGITGFPHFSGGNVFSVAFSRLIPPIDFVVVDNHKSNKFHASALDCVVEKFDFDLLMALETDVLALKPTWLQWFVDQLRPGDFAVGMWHHEQFVNPSCTLYDGNVLRHMSKWCKGVAYVDSGAGDHMLYTVPKDELRWGPRFENAQLVTDRQPERDYRDWYDQNIEWIAGPFAEKRGFREGTVLKEKPTGQEKGPGWYEPGQQLHHWAVQAGHTYAVCPSLTTQVNGVPVQTLYGTDMPDPQRQLEAVEMFGNAEAVHLWGGTRALDIIKHDVTCNFVKSNTPKWLAREARFWKAVVPPDVQAQTLDLIRKWGWHITGQGTGHVSDRDRAAAEFVRGCYAEGGVVI